MTAEAPSRSASLDEALSREFSREAPHLPALLELLDAGVPVPFIAHYRRERVGGLPEEAIREIRRRRTELRRVEERRAEILSDLEARGALADGVRQSLMRARTLAELDDVSRPLGKAPAGPAKELEEKFGPLASAIVGGEGPLSLSELAAPFVSEERGIPDAEAALAGAVRTLASRYAAEPETKAELLKLVLEKGKLKSAVVPEGDAQKKYKTYHDFSQPVKSVPSHRVLAILRGASEGALVVSIELDREEALGLLRARIQLPEDHPAKDQLAKAIEVAWDDFLAPELTESVLTSVKQRAEQESVKIFARNLEQLLLMPPAGPKIVMGVEPGVRRGMKIAVVDAAGTFLGHASIYPFPPRGKVEAAKKTVGDFCRHHKVEMIGIGSGPGCREVERFFRETRKEDEGLEADVVLVNEAGVAAYSGSEKAKAEFPKLDPRVRSAITIARRLQDPLSELVKLTPSAIGVGPYQRDVDQALLDEALGDVVESCVSKVGVDVNRADTEVLRHVPGIGKERAAAIARHREEHGPIRSLEELRKIPGFDEASWLFSAGFLRVEGGENPLDRTPIHPEHYELVGTMAGKLGVEPGELLGNAQALAGLDPAGFAGEDFSLPTVEAVFDALRRPDSDPRGRFEAPEFREDLQSLTDVKEGMTLEGIVTNIASFGAFVDIGVDQEGLIHVSELSDGFVKDPGSVVSVGQKVKVRVLKVDEDRKRLSLSMRTPGAKKAPRGGDRRGKPGGRPAGRPGGQPGGGRGGQGGQGRGGGPGRGGKPGGRGDGKGRGRGKGGGGGRGGGGRGGGRRRDDDGNRPPRVIEQKAKREPEPEIDPGLPEEEKFRLKLERLRKKFEKGK